MKKEKIIGMISLSVIVIIVLSLGVVYAASSIPSKEVYYDNSNSSLHSTNVQSAIDELYYRTYSANLNTIPLKAYLRGFLENSDTVIQDDETAGHNMRFIGSDPSNYISFNGGLWRIVGVFGSDSHGKNEELVKIQYTGTLKKDGANIQWDSNNENDWSKATGQQYLNGEYYYGMSASVRNMIEEVDWKLGGAPWADATMYGNVFYNYERGSTGAKSNPTLTEWTGKVALSYPSDYIFSTNGGSTYDRDACLAQKARNTNNTANEYWRTSSPRGDCATGSWMIMQAVNTSTRLWTLTPRSDNATNVFNVNYSNANGTINNNNANNTNIGVVPAASSSNYKMWYC